MILKKPVYQSALILLLIAMIAGREYASVLVTNPLAANNIYQQQYQLHRFATDFYDGPVAVVDLGWVAYHNDNYVLDLWGLASERALLERASGDPSWMNELAEEQDVQVAMIYDFRFRQLPPNWTPVGAMRLGRRRMSVADDTVIFYALNEPAAEQVRPYLELFRQTLPDGVEFYQPGG